MQYSNFLFGVGGWGDIWSKNQNCQFKLNFGTYSDSNMQNSIVVFTFPLFCTEIPYLGKFVLKTQNCLFKVKFDT